MSVLMVRTDLCEHAELRCSLALCASLHAEIIVGCGLRSGLTIR